MAPGIRGGAVLVAGLLLSLVAWGQAEYDFDPADPFEGLASATEWRDMFRTDVKVDPNDPFHNLSPRDWWGNTWHGEWRSAAARGTTFEEFYAALQGDANGGRSVDIRSPYRYASAQAHWNAWLAAADGGAVHTRETLPDWSGDWSGGAGLPDALIREYWNGVSEEYRPRYEQMLQAELEGRHWWPADECLPNGFARSGWSIRYFMADPSMALLAFDRPVTVARYIFTDGRGFLDEARAIPQWMGESQGFWDDDELVVWTRSILPKSGGHGVPEYSDQLEIIERYAMIGDQMLVDITFYDAAAFAYPWHSVGMFTRNTDREDWARQPPTVNECVSTNNVHHNELGLIEEFGPEDPQWRDLFDSHPWRTVFERAEQAKERGLLPAAPSFLSFGPAPR
ncbi:hypothetical protein [Candidatus Rariloculus sp.]|uniref:hypothetical protein n=1 Tax=Candidatus Rariloculus sp. TaxID=3101265 RepID=UPI003D0C6504